ncbi:LuxR C-terminal-related transcriptional regulator [Streptomyces sp. S.PB5]|nr:LuxR family transcriptional regulator [Streptomyces sp. S.PB5]MDN3027737.1 LuxR C-terminal-related transcriptional regulator [Streptomyces sp. S.PB5]
MAPALPEGVRVRLLHSVYGDPRAAVEAVRLLSARQSAGLEPLPTEPVELAPALLRAHRAEIRRLPDDTRLLLLLAAADQYPVATHAFPRAVAAARLDTRPLEAAEAAGLAHTTAAGVVFRDAWTRIAAYETGSAEDRRDVHRLLARVLHTSGETSLRSWHRGAGALGPSTRLAAELAAAATKSRAAGQTPQARALVERAAALCPERPEQLRLLARAAGYAWQSGDGNRARRLVAMTADEALTGLLALRAGNAAEAFDVLLAAVVTEGEAAGGAGSPGAGAVPLAGEREDGSRTRGGRVPGRGRSGAEDAGSGGPDEGSRVGEGAGLGVPALDAGVRRTARCRRPGEGRAASGAGGQRASLAAPGAGHAADAGEAGSAAGQPAPPDSTAGAGRAAGGASVRSGTAVYSVVPVATAGCGHAAAVASVCSGIDDHSVLPVPAVDSGAAAATASAISLASDGPSSSPHPLTTALDVPDPVLHLLARATEAAMYTGDLRRCREVARVARRMGAEPPGTLGGLAAAFDGRYEDARDLLQAAAGRCGPGGDPTGLIHAGIAALLLGDHTRATAATVRAAASARVRGATVTAVQAMEFRAYADFWTGRPRAGEAAAADALWQAHVTGQDNGACHLQAALAMFAALTGDTEVCRERAAVARSYALAHGLGLPAALAQWALAYLDLSSGRFPAAAARLRALAGFGPGHGHRAIRHLATPHYVEAAVRTGDTRVARTAHADYHRWASVVRSPDDLALSARCRALLAPGAEAIDHYRESLDLHARGTRDLERARTELLFGSALRRLRERTEARDRLHSALEAFEHFGAPHCAARARAELRALGAPATPAQADADDPTTRLTAQQLMIARMAADGATNKEIATRLALSPRTIDHHLRGVFTRLGIRSRIELVRLLGEGGGM